MFVCLNNDMLKMKENMLILTGKIQLTQAKIDKCNRNAVLKVSHFLIFSCVFFCFIHTHTHTHTLNRKDSNTRGYI